METAAKKFQTIVAVPPAPVWVPSQRPLVPSVASVTSVANYKSDNDPGGCAQISWHLPYSRGKLNDVNLIGDDIRTIERKVDVLLNACKHIGLAVNTVI